MLFNCKVYMKLYTTFFEQQAACDLYIHNTEWYVSWQGQTHDRAWQSVMGNNIYRLLSLVNKGLCETYCNNNFGREYVFAVNCMHTAVSKRACTMQFSYWIVIKYSEVIRKKSISPSSLLKAWDKIPNESRISLSTCSILCRLSNSSLCDFVTIFPACSV